jgi:hypothetical protein
MLIFLKITRFFILYFLCPPPKPPSRVLIFREQLQLYVLLYSFVVVVEELEIDIVRENLYKRSGYNRSATAFESGYK